MEAFGIVLIAVSLVAVVVAAASFVGSGKIYRGLGRSGAFTLDTEDRPPGPKAGSPAAQAEAREEMRQLLEAKSYRRVARGEEPLDIDAEMDTLMPSAPSSRDAELREEVRQLVVARNERRLRRGEEPLDVDSEVERQLRDLGA
jgi:hypothetical protein